MDKHPAAYIRRSFVDAEAPGDIAEAAQLAEVRRLAAQDGHNGDLVIYSDWGISADVAKTTKRTEYTRLLDDMDAGRISAVYAFDTDRLYRDPRDLIRLQDAAQRHGVTITTKAGRLPIGAGDDPAGEGFAFITAVFGRMELQKSKKRNRAAREARIARGDDMDPPGYGWKNAREEGTGRIVHVPDGEHDPAIVVDLYRQTGSIMKTAKALQARGIPAPKGGTRWGQSTTRRVLEREAPELFPRPSRTTGRRTPANSMFAQLLACKCGTTLTPNAVRHQYYCNNGHRLGSAVHGKITVSEITVSEWMRDEMLHFHLPAAGVEIQTQNAARRVAVTNRLERARELFLEEGDRKRWEHEKTRAAQDIDALDSTETVVREWPELRDLWTYKPAAIAKILREILVRVDLDAKMEPTSATWRNPSLRRACDDPACTHCPRHTN
jgi:DNA invertase Pin-like site-specific DNA recombinase